MMFNPYFEKWLSSREELRNGLSNSKQGLFCGGCKEITNAVSSVFHKRCEEVEDSSF